MADNEILQQILGELKNIKESQAVIERDLRDVRSGQQVVQINIDKLSRNQASIEQGQAKLQNQITSVEESLQTVRNSQLKVELEQFPKIAAAIDGVLGGIDKNKAQDERIEYLEKKADKHDARLYVLEASTKKAL